MFKRLRQLADVSAARPASIPGDSTETPNAGFLSIGKLGHEGVDPARLHFVAIDVETTGLEPTQHRVIELAMVRFMSDGTVLDEWSTLLDPRRDVGPVEIHGIDNTQVVDAPEFSAIAGHVLARLDGAVVVGHNVGFDSRFLDCEFRRVGLPVQTLPGLCTIELQQLLDPGSQRLRLGSAAQKYGLRNPGRHSALEDARVTALLVCAQLVAAERWNKGSKVVLRVPPVTFQIPPLTAQPKVRIAGLTKGTDGWLASMVSKLPASFQPEIDPIVAHAYSNALVEVVADGKVTKMEAERLGLLRGPGRSQCLIGFGVASHLLDGTSGGCPRGWTVVPGRTDAIEAGRHSAWAF